MSVCLYIHWCCINLQEQLCIHHDSDILVTNLDLTMQYPFSKTTKSLWIRLTKYLYWPLICVHAQQWKVSISASSFSSKATCMSNHGRTLFHTCRGVLRCDYTHEIFGDACSYFRGDHIPRSRRLSIICRTHPHTVKCWTQHLFLLHAICFICQICSSVSQIYKSDVNICLH